MTRDDFFTTIHKALRKGLFDVTVAAGATDWADAAEVAKLRAQWVPLLDLLRSHNRHEELHIMPLLGGQVPAITASTAEQHDDLDGLLDEVADGIELACRTLEPASGLDAYRNLNRFVSGYLMHLHYEETVVMPQIWAVRDDAELAAARAALMADIPPDERAYSLQLLLPSIDATTRRQLQRSLAS